MKVLIAADYNAGNPYIHELSDSIASFTEVITDRDLFLKMSSQDFDIVHLHWPESYCSIKRVTDEDINYLEEVISYWQKRAKLVLTLHNENPHLVFELPVATRRLVERLYALFFSNINGVIHMGEYSLQVHSYLFPEYVKHISVLHGLYGSYPNVASASVARNHIGISGTTKTVLIFGGIRKPREISLAIKTLFRLPREYVIICPGLRRLPKSTTNWMVQYLYQILRLIKAFFYLPFVRKYNFGYIISITTDMQWIAALRHILKANKLQRRVFYDTRYVPDEDVQYFFNAADAVFIPRVDALNSGVIPLAFAFSKPVVGPRVGNITELLEVSRNGLYEPGDYIGAAQAVQELFEDDLVEIGRENNRYGQEHMNWDSLAKQHIEFYQSLLED